MNEVKVSEEQVITTPALRMDQPDWNKWANNAFKFLAPLGLLYAAFVTANLNLDGFQTTDFQPTREVIGALMLYILNAGQDFLRKFTVEQKYPVEK